MSASIKTHCSRGHELVPKNRTKDGRHCLTCSRERARQWAKNNRERHNARGKQWYSDHKDTAWIRWIKNAYKMTADTFKQLLRAQDNRCGICRKPFASRPCVDHAHSCCPSRKACGQCNRGLLCRDCNQLLRALENPEWRKAADEYLISFNSLPS